MPLHYFPAIGAYIVFTIDVEATVSTYNDPILLKAAQEIKLKTYAGFVRDSAALVSDTPYSSHFLHFHLQVNTLNPCPPWWRCVSVHLLGQGIAKPDENSTTSSMCSPILPETSHPDKREPIAPSNPLPWKNCYHYTHTAPVQVRTNWKKTRKAARHGLTTDQIEDYEARQMDDAAERARRRDPELWARLDAERVAFEYTEPVGWDSSDLDTPTWEEAYELFGDSDGEGDGDSEVWTWDDESCNSTLGEDSDGEDERTVEDGCLTREDPDESIPVVRASYKLSRVRASELSDPAEFWEDVEVLRR
ncbi:hypothetical protein AX16_006355 [Volvariella volvacea WC 439]|nr:hypothetical protein AX16_006355 [Volvariella volvacea WC 439]